MKKRFLSIMLCLCMVLTLLPTAALAATTTVGNGSDLQTACTNAAEGDTILLTSGIILNSNLTINNSNNFTLDLGGFSINCGDANKIILSGGKVTVTDSTNGSSEITGANPNNDSGVIEVTETGSLEVAGATIRNTCTGGGSAAIYNNGGTVKVSGGAVRAVDFAIHNTSEGNVTVTTGTVNATGNSGRSIYNASGTVAVSGGTVWAANSHAVYIESPSETALTVSGGSVITTGTGIAIYNRLSGTVTITGGGVSAVNGHTIYNYANGTITVSGVTLSSNAGGSRKVIWNVGSGTVNVTDAKLSTSGHSSSVISNDGTGTVNISGALTEITATGQYGYAVQNLSTGTINLGGGKITSSYDNNVKAINNTSTGAINITGPVVVQGKEKAIYSKTVPMIAPSFAGAKAYGSTDYANLAPAAAPVNLTAANLGNYKYLEYKVPVVNDQTTFVAACNAAGEGETVALTGSFSLTGDADITNTNNFTIDLNGKTITCGTDYSINLSGAGKVTIDDSQSGGKITGENRDCDSGTIDVASTGSLVVKGGTVEAIGYRCNAISNKKGTVTVDGGKVSATGQYGNAIYEPMLIGGGTVKVSSGEVTAANGYAINNYNNLTVEGGTVSTTSGVAIINSSSAAKFTLGGTNCNISGSTYAIDNAVHAEITIAGPVVLKGNTKAINDSFVPAIAASFTNGRVKGSSAYDGSNAAPVILSPENLSSYKYLEYFSATPAEAPTFATNLSADEQVVSTGASTTLTVAANNVNDGGAVTYQWYSNTANNTSGTSIGGATGESYTFNASNTANTTTYYYCIITNTNSYELTATATSVVKPVRTKNNVATMASFSFAAPSATGVVGSNTVSVTVPWNTDVAALTPTITLTDADHATVNPASGAAQNFASPVTYTVTAEDGTTQSYTVTVTVGTPKLTSVTAPSAMTLTGKYATSAAVIESNELPTTVTITAENSTTRLPCVWTCNSYSAASGAENTFHWAATTTGYDVNGKTVSGDVTITNRTYSNAKAITAFSIGGASGTINEPEHTIAVSVPFGTAVTALTPSITVSADAAVSPASGAAQNFTSPVTYTVTAEDGSEQNYIVTVTLGAAPALAGTVSISGTAKYGEQLSAVTTNITNNTGTLSYQWKRSGSDSVIGNESTYTLAAEDIGQTITVTVTSSVQTGSLTSAATATVAKVDGPAAPEQLAGVKPTTLNGNDGKITGTTAEMEYSTSTAFASAQSCTPTETTGLSANTYYVRVKETTTHSAGTYATVVVPAGDAATVTAISINSSTHKTAYQVGEALDVTNLTISATMSYGNPQTISVTSGMVSGFNSAAVAVNQTLTITYEGQTAMYNISIAKADTAAPSEPTLSSKTHNSITVVPNALYQFRLGTDGIWQNSNVFSELSPSTEYTIYARVAETTTNAASPSSAAGLTVTTDAAPIGALTGTVTISGTEKFDSELTAEVTASNNTGTLSYQWKRDGSTNIGSNSTKYTLVAEDISHTITCTVTSSVETGAISSSATGTIAKADGPAAAGVTKTDCTTASNNNGTLVGVTSAMQYKLSTAQDWTNGDGSTISSLSNGTYYVRVKEDATHNAGAQSTFTIAAYSAPSSPGSSSSGSSTPSLVTAIKNEGSITGSNLDRLISSGKDLTVTDTSTGAKLVFDTEALKGIDKETSGSLKVEIEDVSAEHQTTHEGKNVYALTVTSGNKTVSDFGGSVTVSLPYALKDGEKAEDVAVWYLASDGTMTEIPCTYDAKTKLATFTVTHFSEYVVGVRDWVNPFQDVSEDVYYYDAVAWAVKNGVTSGTSATTFAPNTTCTRAQTVTFLWRAMGSPEPTGTDHPFTDVSADAYYYKAVLWAVEKGVTAGTSATTFSPNATVSRSQTVTFLWRTAGKPVASYAMSFDDVAQDAYYTEAVRWAVSEGITRGSSAATFAPEQDCTRAQIVTFLYRYLAK